jgi:hypothetical protein
MIRLQGGGRLHLVHVHLTVLGAQRWPGQFEPFTRGMNSIAAIAAGALDRPGGRLFASVGMTAGANGQLKGCRVAAALQLPVSAAWPSQTRARLWWPPFALLALYRCQLAGRPCVASRNANRGVY